MSAMLLSGVRGWVLKVGGSVGRVTRQPSVQKSEFSKAIKDMVHLGYLHGPNLRSAETTHAARLVMGTCNEATNLAKERSSSDEKTASER